MNKRTYGNYKVGSLGQILTNTNNKMNMELKDYLHFYFGCLVQIETVRHTKYGPEKDCRKGTFIGFGEYNRIDVRLAFRAGPEGRASIMFIKPILRPLSDMTQEELQKCGNMIYDFSDDPELNNHQWKDFEIGLAPEQFAWLLSKHFDIFGLIKAGLAIDATTIKPFE